MYTLGKVRNPSKAEERLNEEAQAQDYANALFKKLDPARKRIAIARDVLKWLRIDKIVATQGTYLYPSDKRMQDVEDSPVVNGDRCGACALGAVFACYAERIGGVDELWWKTSEEMRDILAPFFDLEQLQLIEAAFERRAGFAAQSPDKYKAVKFGANFLSDKARMAGIMENIIANKGTFVP